MTLERLYVIPHGDEIIDLPNAESRSMAESIQEMTSGDRSDTVAIISPHGLALSEKVSVICTEHLKGYFKLKSRILRKNYSIDVEDSISLAGSYPDYAERVNFVTSSGPMSVFPADFGTLIPLQFFGKRSVIAMGQPRPTKVNNLLEFGKILSDFVAGSERRISVVISADQAHTHSAKGPYGYSEKAEIYDRMINDAVKRSDFREILRLDPEFISQAKPDSFWNMAILSGFLDKAHLKLNFGYYYVEEYFGMLSAYASPA